MSNPVSSNQGMRIAARQSELDDIMAQVSAAITNLNTVAATASSAINNSAVDRAAIHTQLNALTARLNTAETALTSLAAVANGDGFGSAPVPTLSLLNATTDITVTLNHDMPSATYTTAVVLSPNLAGKFTATVKTKTKNTVVVTVTASLLAAGSGTVAVIAWT